VPSISWGTWWVNKQIVGHSATFDFSTESQSFVTVPQLDFHLPYDSFVVMVGISIQRIEGVGAIEIHVCQDGSGAILPFHPVDAQDFRVDVRRNADCISFKLCSLGNFVRIRGDVSVLTVPPDPSAIDQLVKIIETRDEQA